VTNEWFSGDPPRNQDETTFLEQLRQAAGDWDSLGVAPEDTLVWTALNPLYVQVEVPQLSHNPKDGISLQVGYWPAPASGLCLQAEWGDGHRLDNGGHADDLAVGGIVLTPEAAATLAAVWFRQQLARPLERQEWVNRQGVTIATRWRRADTGRVLNTEGSLLGRLLRRTPDRVVPLVNPSEHR
jgi:hypothetical protein